MVVLHRPAHVSFVVGILQCRGGKLYQWFQRKTSQKLKLNPDCPVPKLDLWVISPHPVIITAFILVLPLLHVATKRLGNKLGKKFSSIQLADFLENSRAREQQRRDLSSAKYLQCSILLYLKELLQKVNFFFSFKISSLEDELKSHFLQLIALAFIGKHGYECTVFRQIHILFCRFF